MSELGVNLPQVNGDEDASSIQEPAAKIFAGSKNQLRRHFELPLLELFTQGLGLRRERLGNVPGTVKEYIHLRQLQK